MGNVLRFHARAPAGSTGYRSGRSSCRGTPEIRSTAITRSGGTSSHCATACNEIPSAAANLVGLPTLSIATLSAALELLMPDISSTALLESQASLHCVAKGGLYALRMTLGTRIQAARKRLKLTQKAVGEVMKVTPQAVSQWERDEDIPEFSKAAALARVLKVPTTWLIEGTGDPPDPDDLLVRLETLPRAERALLGALLDKIGRASGRERGERLRVAGIEGNTCMAMQE